MSEEALFESMIGIILLPTRTRMLDFGCGPVYEAMRLHDVGADVVGIDISAKSIEIARSIKPHVQPERMSGVLSSIAALVRYGSGSIKSGMEMYLLPGRYSLVHVLVT